MDKIIGNDYIYNMRKIRLVFIEDKKAVYWCYENCKYDWLYIANLNKLHVIDKPQAPKPEPKPIYTQAMTDHNILPLVGMECQTSTGKVTVRYIGKKLVITEDNEGCEFTLTKKLALHSLKPLTLPKTDEEKAFDRLYIRMTLEMERRFELSKINNHSMVNDDTQVGVEFAIEYMRKNINIKVKA